jgi:hypothetical protein
MDTMLKTSIWQQFGAAIDTLDDAINLCPDHLWTVQMWKDTEDERYGQFWYITYHTLSWLDLFLTSTYKDFLPPPPFIRGKLPEIPYTKDQIQWYLNHCRSNVQSTIEALTDEKARQICQFEWMEPTYLELQLYSMRHVQEHAAQLNLVLGQHDITGMDWIAKARDKAAHLE